MGVSGDDGGRVGVAGAHGMGAVVTLARVGRRAVVIPVGDKGYCIEEPGGLVSEPAVDGGGESGDEGSNVIVWGGHAYEGLVVKFGLKGAGGMCACVSSRLSDRA